MAILARYLAMSLPMMELHRVVRRAVLVGAFVALFVLVFTPFDYHLFSFGERLQWALIVASLVALSEITLSGVFRKIVTWRGIHTKVWHHLLLCLTVIVTCSQLIYLYTIVLGLNSFLLRGALIYLVCTLAVASFPLAIVLLVRLREMRPPQKLEVTAGNATTLLSVEHIALVCAYDNYVKLFSINGGKGNDMTVARIPLYQIEERLGPHPNFYRCHRSFIINLSMVERIEGSTSSCTVHLKGHPYPVPVARSKVHGLRQMLTT